MAVFEVVGTVVSTVASDIGVRVENVEALLAFWEQNQIKTQLWRDSDKVPVISVGRKSDIDACSVGDRVRLTFETVDRANGRGIQTIAFQVLPGNSEEMPAR